MADKFLEQLTITTGLNSSDVLYLVRLPASDPNDYQIAWVNVMNQIEADLDFPHPLSYHSDADGEFPGSTGQVWRFNASSLRWIQTFLSYNDLVDQPTTPVAHDLDFHSDVNVPAPTDGFFLQWDNGTSRWIDADPIPPSLEHLEKLGYQTHDEEIDQSVTSDGVTITYHIDNMETPGADIHFFMGETDTIYPLSVPATLTLPAGTDANPRNAYVYVELVTGSLVLKETMDLVPIIGQSFQILAEVEVQSAVKTQTDGGALWFRGMDHHVEGHLANIDNRIRIGVPPDIFSGLDFGATIVPSTVMNIDLTDGWVFGLHIHYYPARDTASGDTIIVANDPAGDFSEVANVSLTNMPQDSNGGSLGNRWFNLFLYTTMDTEGLHRLVVNLPTGSYGTSNQSDAETDIDQYTDYSNPFGADSAQIPLYRIPMKFDNGGNITLGSVVDLREGGIAAGSSSSQPTVIVAELDLVPRFTATEIQFNNGSVTDAGGGVAQVDVAAHTAEEMTNFSSGASEQQVPKFSSGISTWIPGFVDWTELSNKPLTFPPDGGPYVPVAGGTFTGNLLLSTGNFTPEDITIASPSGSAAPDFSDTHYAKISLNGNLTLNDPIGIVEGGLDYHIVLRNNSGSGKTITWGANYKGANGTDHGLPTSIANGERLVVQIYKVGADFLSVCHLFA